MTAQLRLPNAWWVFREDLERAVSDPKECPTLVAFFQHLIGDNIEVYWNRTPLSKSRRIRKVTFELREKRVRTFRLKKDSGRVTDVHILIPKVLRLEFIKPWGVKFLADKKFSFPRKCRRKSVFRYIEGPYQLSHLNHAFPHCNTVTFKAMVKKNGQWCDSKFGRWYDFDLSDLLPIQAPPKSKIRFGARSLKHLALEVIGRTQIDCKGIPRLLLQH